MTYSNTFTRIKDFIDLHLCVLVYSISTVLIKSASRYQMMSFNYILLMCLSIAILGVYAILWQQVIKKFKPSVAYSNKSITTIWTLLASAIFFGEGITVQNVVGAIIIIVGVILIAQEQDNE